MATYAPLRDTMHELNQLMIESRQWDSQQKAAQAAWGLQEMELQNRIKNDEQMRQINQVKAEEAKAALEPQEFSVFNFLSDTPYTRRMLFDKNGGAFGKELAGSLKPGITLGADGKFMDPSGEPLKINKLQFDKVAPALYSIATKYDDPQFELSTQIEDLDGQVSQVDKLIKDLPNGDVRFQPKRAELLVQRNKLVGQRDNYYAQTQPEKILEKLQQNYANLNQYAVAASTYGHNPQLNTVISEAKAQLNSRIKGLEDSLIAERLADIKAGKAGSGELKLAYMLDANDNIIGSKYVPVAKNKAGLTPHEADATFDPKQKVIWAPELERLELKNKGEREALKNQYSAVRRNFYDEAGVVIRGPVDIMKERIAQQELVDMYKNDRTKGKNDVAVIQEAVTYADKVLDEFDAHVNVLKETAMTDPRFTRLNPEQQKAMLDAIDANTQREWQNTYGFPLDQFRKMYKESADAWKD